MTVTKSLMSESSTPVEFVSISVNCARLDRSTDPPLRMRRWLSTVLLCGVAFGIRNADADDPGKVIKLETSGIKARIARSIGEPAVYGVGSPVARVRDYPVYFQDRAEGRHPDGARELIGQIAAAVGKDDKVTVERIERSGQLVRLWLRHQPRPRPETVNRAAAAIADFNLLEDVRRLSVKYENARAAQSDPAAANRWLLKIALHMVARAEIESNANEARKLRNQALERVQNARKFFSADVDETAVALNAFPVFIDPKQDPKLRRQRAAVEVRYITAQLQLGSCSMIEALTHPPRSDDRADQLSAAARAFETIYQKYRSQLGGLIARVSHARCLQFLEKHDQALGIYGELLAYPGKNGALLRIRDQALHYSLISLNDDRKAWNIVIDRAGGWIAKASHEQQRSIAGAGILWKEARAMWGAREGAPIRPLPELLGDNDARLVLRATLKTLQEVAVSENRHALRASERIPAVLAALGHQDEPAPDDPDGQSIYFQVPLPALPTGNYQVRVTLETAAADGPQPQVSGRFQVDESSRIGTQLAQLATRAIAMRPSPPAADLSRDTQTPHGLDLSKILVGTQQQELVKTFPTDHVQFERACGMLREHDAKWALCAILDHANVDAKIYAARQLTRMADADTVCVLLAAAKRNNYGVSGSESATLHSIYRQELRKALEAATRLKLTPGGLSYLTVEDGERIRITSDAHPERFPEDVDFARVEKWLREVYLPQPAGQAEQSDRNPGESGLIGRVTVDGIVQS